MYMCGYVKVYKQIYTYCSQWEFSHAVAQYNKYTQQQLALEGDYTIYITKGLIQGPVHMEIVEGEMHNLKRMSNDGKQSHKVPDSSLHKVTVN